MPSAYAAAAFEPHPATSEEGSLLAHDRSLDDRAETFYDQATALHLRLDSLKSHFDTLRALSARLFVLHPNALETPTLALDLRSALVAAAGELKRIDRELFELWADEERVRLTVEGGRYRLKNVAAVGDEEGELEERRDEVDGLVRRFARRVKEVRREARGERKDRKAAQEREEPAALGDYLEEGSYEWPHVLTKDTVHASRWVVSNPFTILVRLTDQLKSLKIPHLLATKSTPSTFIPPPSPPPLYPFSSSAPSSSAHRFPPSSAFPDSPTPAGSSTSSPLTGWKQQIVSSAATERSKRDRPLSRRIYDELAQDGAEGWREIKVATGRGHRERWILFLTLALFPVLIIANLIEDLLSSRSTSSSAASSSAAAAGSSGGSLSLRTLAPTMVEEEGLARRAVQTAMSGQGEVRLRERRRRSVELDAALV
ncbi:hypothetical protein JCM8097_008792 [Rhodosporidiobolus ruineniae]